MMTESSIPSSMYIMDDGKTFTFTASGLSVSSDTGKRAEFNSVKIKKTTEKYVKWGQKDDLPVKIIQSIEKSVDLSTGLGFNSDITLGAETLNCYQTVDGVIKPFTPTAAMEDFLSQTPPDWLLKEQITDHFWFGHSYIRPFFDKNKQISRLSHVDAPYSRVSQQKRNGTEYASTLHFFHPNFGIPNETMSDIIVSKLVDASMAVMFLIEETKSTAKSDVVIRLASGLPGNPHYPRPLWWSVFDSGWYDYSVSIPEYKKQIMGRQVNIRYIIEFHPDYWASLFQYKKIPANDESAQKQAQEEEIKSIRDFLGDRKNPVKDIQNFMKMRNDGTPYSLINIKTMDTGKIESGAYVEDSEEARNILLFALSVHPSLVGASPGKGKTINGTEARELFVIKQAMTKPLQRRIINSTYGLVHKINGIRNPKDWPKGVYYDIPFFLPTTKESHTDAVITT